MPKYIYVYKLLLLYSMYKKAVLSRVIMYLVMRERKNEFTQYSWEKKLS